jgi:formamidopyrimidine-DNA glycosylase
MAELPEISKIAEQMDDTFKGKTISSLIVEQEKCINVPVNEFKERITDSKISDVRYKGKWFIINLSNSENILISLGMGGDLHYYNNLSRPLDKYQIRVEFSNSSGFTIKFWWFGKFLISSDDELINEKNTKDIGKDTFDD